MKFLVIGEPCIDMIYKADGEAKKSYGGILYSIISLAVISRKEDVVLPVINIGEDEFDNIKDVLSKYSNIDTSGLYKMPHSTRKVNLYFNYYNSGKRAKFEQVYEPTYTIKYEQIEKFLPGADSILINNITGYDISLDDLKKIRGNFKGYIHMDIHNLVMKTNTDGTREHTTLPNWREWCSNTDTIQLNEFEVQSMSREKKNEYEVIEEILLNQTNEVKAVVVTKGKIGASGYTKKVKKYGSEVFTDLDKIEVGSIENPRYKDSTGCGDVFAAALTYDYTKNKDIKKSLHFANRLASYKTSLEGIDELYKLK